MLPDATVIMIDEKEYFESTPMIPSCMVQRDRWKRCSLPHTAYLREGKDQLIVGKAVALHPNHVVVGSNKQIVPFDFCINFSGSRYTSDIKTNNITMAHRDQRMAKERENIAKCKEVVCIGGGLVGTEIASNIKDEFPDKPVTLIHRGSMLMPRQTDAHELLMKRFAEKGIKVKLNCEGREFQMDEDDNGYFPLVTTVASAETRSPEVTGDIENLDDESEQRLYVDGVRVYWCTGYKANVSHIKAGPLRDHIDSKGFVDCDDYLRIGGIVNIFTGGDCTTAKAFANGERTAHYAALHAVACVTNIKHHINDEPLEPFRPNPQQRGQMLLVELGKSDADDCP